MTINRGYAANHKIFDEISRLTPNVELSESHRPFIQRMVAPWLPVTRWDEEEKAWFVISTGKVVSETSDGRLVLSGYRKLWNSLIGVGTAAITYTANDVTNKTMDITTGAAVAAATTYTEAEITAALRERGLIRHTERAMDFISQPVGIASMNYWASASYTNNNDPKTFLFHNFSKQVNCPIVCDYVIELPVLPAKATTEATANRMTEAAGYMEDIFDGTTARSISVTGFFSSTQIAEVTRYASEVSAGDDVVAFMTVNYPVAVDTVESTIETSTDACLVRQVDSIGDIRAAGDYYWDYAMGVLFLYEAGGDAVPSPWVAATTTITYYHYGTEGTSTNTPTTYACATGELTYGDFLTYDTYSNLVKATLDIEAAPGYWDNSGTDAQYSDDPTYTAATDTDTDAAISLQLEQAISNYTGGIVGQIVGTEIYGEGRYDNDYLSRVRTVFNGYTTATMRVPGTATGGRTDQLTYAKGAEKMVIVNLIMR